MVKSTPRAPSSGNPAEPEEGQATLLVSEFPPVPFYYRLASTGELLPPPIPTEALARGTSRASAQAARARAESERLRSGDEDETDAILGGVPAAEDEDDGDVVAVFGEIVEDPLLMEPLDRCEDPRVVRDEVKRLNQDVVKGFVKLVQDLVHRPIENK
jgi:mediator of RNA polymerase II transcription subunit 7